MHQTVNPSASLTNERMKAIRAIKLMLFTASIMPSITGGALAYYHNSFDWPYFLIVLIALFVGQAGGDYLYYYFTHRHTDPRDAHTKIFAGWKPLFADSLPEKNGTLYAGIFCLLIDLIIGIYFYMQLGYMVAVLALIGGAVAIFFTPLMLKGFKEPVIFFTFGPLSVTGMYFVLTGELSWAPVFVSLPIGFLITAVAHLKGAHYEVKDEKGEEVVLKLNPRRVIILFALAYFHLLIGIIFGKLPLISAVALITIPMAYSIIKMLLKKTSKVQDYLWAVVRTINVMVVTGLIIAISLII